jgi:hypothetical protein
LVVEHLPTMCRTLVQSLTKRKKGSLKNVSYTPFLKLLKSTHFGTPTHKRNPKEIEVWDGANKKLLR